MRFIQNFKFKAHILYIDNLFNRQAYELIIFLDLNILVYNDCIGPSREQRQREDGDDSGRGGPARYSEVFVRIKFIKIWIFNIDK